MSELRFESDVGASATTASSGGGGKRKENQSDTSSTMGSILVLHPSLSHPCNDLLRGFCPGFSPELSVVVIEFQESPRLDFLLAEILLCCSQRRRSKSVALYLVTIDI